MTGEIDTPAMIKYCLDCPWPKCWNCLGQNNAYSWALKNDLKEEKDETEK